MKTRIVKTKLWSDQKIGELSPNSRYFFVYLLTSPSIGLTSIFECPDRLVSFQTGLSLDDISDAKKELQKWQRAFFKDHWVWIVNAERHNRYRNSPANEKAFEEELRQVPSQVMSYFKSSGYSTPLGTHKPKAKNKNGGGIHLKKTTTVGYRVIFKNRYDDPLSLSTEGGEALISYLASDKKPQFVKVKDRLVNTYLIDQVVPIKH